MSTADAGRRAPDASGVCSVTDLGMTGWCKAGRHDRCAHRVGGPLEGGLWMPECSIRFGTAAKGYSDTRYARFSDGSVAYVVSPSHRYRCPCECHKVGQLAMFEVVA